MSTELEPRAVQTGNVTTTVAVGTPAPWPRRIRLAATVVLLVLPLIVLPLDPLRPQFVWDASNAAYSLGTAAAVFAILAYGISVMLRFSGLASMGHGALFGVGAYATAIVMERAGLGFSVTLITSVLVTALLGVAVGALALRMHGMAFLIITIALGELLVLVMLNWKSLTNGTLGMYMKGTPSLLGLPLNSPVRRYLVAVVFLYLVIAATWGLSRSRFGRRLVAIRDNEALARSLGLNTFLYKLTAFTISAAISGLAGHLYYMHMRAITHDLFGVMATITVFLMVVMGGSRALLGPAVGAWVVVHLPVWFEPLGLTDPHRQEIAFGVLLMAFMLLAPAGIVGGFSQLADRFGRREDDAPVVPFTPAVASTAGAPTATTAASLARPSSSPRTYTEADVLLRIDGIVKAYGALRAVDGVSFDVHRGEVVGLIGPNGSGKTTLVNCITGFQGLTEGRVIWKGDDVSRARPHQLARKGVVRTFQQSMSFAEYTPREHCELLWDTAGAGQDGPVLIDSVDDALRLFGLDEVADVKAQELPYGSVSNLGVAAALASRRPELLVLDEPAAGLTSAEGLALQRRLLMLRERGLTILIIDHDMSFLMPMCDRVVVLDAGAKVMEGMPGEVQKDTRVIAAYLGERFAKGSTATKEEGL